MARVGCQGRGGAEVVPPHACHPFLLATLLLQGPAKSMALLGQRWSLRPQNPISARVFMDIHSHGERARLWPGGPPHSCVCCGIMWLWLPTSSPTVAPEISFSIRKS